MWTLSVEKGREFLATCKISKTPSRVDDEPGCEEDVLYKPLPPPFDSGNFYTRSDPDLK